MLLLILSLVNFSSAADFARLRSFYKQGCEYELVPPLGFRTATGVMIAADVTVEELELGTRLLRRQVERAAPGDASLASFLYGLSAERADGELEDLFFTYLQRPGNEEMVPKFALEIGELVISHLALSDVPEAKIEERIGLLIDVLRDDPVRQGPVWDDLILNFLVHDHVKIQQVLSALESFREDPRYLHDALDFYAEVMRDVEPSVAGLRVNAGRQPTLKDLPLLVALLRLDSWVRAATGLSHPPEMADILMRIGFLGQRLTRH